ncbi:MAG: hypothetical protein ACK46G_14675 [Flavobacteriales bacterium]|jgi:hypothetical protein
MMRNLTLFLACSLTFSLFAATGGPDAYGYLWKDSDEPDGPVFDWIDITTTGTLVSGLGDDNRVGPFVMETDMPFYWYGRKLVWIGSNGYIAFNGVGNLASPFPAIPTAGGVNDHIDALGSDLNFAGAGNQGRCYWQDETDRTIISWVGVPFWSPLAPSYTGENSFQIILSKTDSTITFQYLTQTGLTQNNDIVIGIESVAGSIGLQHSNDVYPATNYAVRFYMPPASTLEVKDATVNWSTAVGSAGVFRTRNGAPFAMIANVSNIGNTDIGGFNVQGQLLNSGGAVQASGQVTLGNIVPGLDTTFTYPAFFNPTTSGIYRYRNTISGIAGELVTTNNERIQEVVVVDTTTATHDLNFHGATDDGIGLGWNGGNGGVGVRIAPPYYPAYVTHYTVRIASNTGNVGYTLKVYDDDGPAGRPGTLLDSINIAPSQAVAGSQVFTLTAPITVTSGAVYVQWYMLGANINIAQDITPPFSLQSYEVLDNTWADYRDREVADFFLGLRLSQVPVFDVGCTGFFGLADGQEIGSQTAVRAWVTNFGNQPVSSFAVKYRFGNGAISTQNYSGTPVNPGAQTLVTFSTYFLPTADANDALCAWSEMSNDAQATNDTTCVQLQTWVGLVENTLERVTLAPNPATEGTMIIGLPSATWELRLFDATGRAVVQHKVATTGSPLQVALNGLAEGTYRLLLTGDAGQWNSTLVVRR